MNKSSNTDKGLNTFKKFIDNFEKSLVLYENKYDIDESLKVNINEIKRNLIPIKKNMDDINKKSSNKVEEFKPEIFDKNQITNDIKKSNDEEQNLNKTIKPGTIPKDSSKNKVVIEVKNEVEFIIPNAKKNVNYEQLISAKEKNIKITKIETPDECGLVFKEKLQKLEGIPTKSGDIKLNIYWKYEGKHEDEYYNEYKIIINPDPKELWQNIEAPKDLEFYKENKDKKLIINGKESLIAASVRGRSHAHNGSCRDDDFFIGQSPNTKWNILIVADGAGSAKCSREGSRLAVTNAGEYLKNELDGEITDNIIDGLGIKNNNINPIESTTNTLIKLFQEAVKKSYNSILSVANQHSYSFNDFYTTLLITIHKKLKFGHIFASLWIGDGAIVINIDDKKFELLGRPDSGEFAGQTIFLNENILKNSDEISNRLKLKYLNDYQQLILMTDGVSDPFFETDNELLDDNKWILFIQKINNLINAKNPDEKLEEWLDFFSQGHHDDRTIAVLK